MFDLSSILGMFGGQNGFLSRLNSFGQQFRQQNSCTPEQKVYELLDSSQMSQEQFNTFANIATALTGRRPF